MKDTTKQLHIAAQYLAMAGKNYVEHQSDDSHANLGWIKETNSFVTHKLSNGDTLELDTCAMTLNWNGASGGTFKLSGVRHKDVLKWLNQIALDKGLKAYVFDLHYDIGHEDLTDEFPFTQVDNELCTQIARLRSLAYASCEQVLSELDLKSDVRTWPHHFDTGAYVSIPKSKIGIGFGMAIPDNLSSDYYLYTSGYKGHEGMSTEGFSALTKGSWKDGEWKGGLLPVKGLIERDYTRFFEETIKAITQRIN